MADDYDEAEGLSLVKLRQQFSNYASAKSNEIDEWRMAHRYYSGVQYDRSEVSALAKRKQPVITFNRVSRKIDGVVGTIRRLRTDPKAFPRTANQQEAADLATQVIRYVCDAADFENIEAEAALASAVIGYAGCELALKPGPNGDYDVDLLEVDSRTFFYDPRSFKPDFSDARFMGTYKWVSVDEIEEIAPGKGSTVAGEQDGGYSTQGDTDRDDKWTDDKGRVKLVDHWYIHKGEWHWCLHVGTTKIASGRSPFYDEDGRSLCKYLMWSAYVDHEGDRYGLVRNLKGPQDAMNQHRSKAIWIMNARQVIARRGAVADIEKLRSEMMRPDGVVEYDGDAAEFQIQQPDQEFLQQTQYFQDAKAEIENFGPNPALIGTGVQATSGRAMAMMQQTGLAELGPFLKNFRMWKLRIYKAVWGAVKTHWKSERWLRITGNNDVAEFVRVNQVGVDEYGMPVVVNQLGAADVDIIIEEGPDTENVMGDVFDTMLSLAQNGAQVPPQVLIEMSTLPNAQKEKILGMLSQSSPVEEQAAKIKMEQEAAKAAKTKAEAYKVETEGLINEAQLQTNVAMLGAMMQTPMVPDPVGGMMPAPMPAPVPPQAVQPPMSAAPAF